MGRLSVYSAVGRKGTCRPIIEIQHSLTSHFMKILSGLQPPAWEPKPSPLMFHFNR